MKYDQELIIIIITQCLLDYHNLSVDSLLTKSLHAIWLSVNSSASSIFNPVFDIASAMSLYHLRREPPTGHFPCGIHRRSLTSCFRCTWPYHLSWLRLIWVSIGSKFKISLIVVFRNLSLLVIPMMSLRTLISATCILRFSFLVNVKVSLLYISIGLSMLLYIITFTCAAIYSFL